MGHRNVSPQRARVRRLREQETYPEMLSLDVRDPRDWFPWFLASSLFAKPISAVTARKTAVLLFRDGIVRPAAIKRRGWDGLVAILDRGGYVRYDFSTATKLLAIAEALPGDALRTIVRGASSAGDVEGALTRIKGVGPKTVAIFLRELRGEVAFPLALSEEARSAAKRLRLPVLGLPKNREALSRIESVLVRTWVEHCKRGRWQGCPAGPMCGCLPPARRHGTP